MMFTFGDVRNPVAASSELIEDIVKQQVIELVKPCSVLERMFPLVTRVLDSSLCQHRTEARLEVHVRRRCNFPDPA